MNLTPFNRDWHRFVTLGEVWRKRPRLGLPSDYPALPDASPLHYALAASAQEAITAHAQSASIEVGGLLLGEVYEERGRYLVSIAQALPARHTEASLACLTFTGETWLDLTARRAAHPELKTVGWYHSHPGMGVFLSHSDMFVHRNFFGDQPWYIALVIDPLSGEVGIFGWRDTQVIRYDSPNKKGRQGGIYP